MELRGGGTLALRREGNRVRFTAERPRDDRGLYKVWLRGKQGSQLLGTLVPEGELLRLERSFSVEELERRGCWPVEGAEVRLVYSFGPRKNDGWTVISDLPAGIGDPLLRRSVRGKLWGRRGEEGRYLVAGPFRTDRPVALEPLFCLGRVEEGTGQPCIIWSFDGAGRPCLPASPPANMQDNY